MEILRPGFDLEQFFASLGSAQRRALLLDYDGTLAPFRVARDQAAPYTGVRALLAAMLRAGHTRIVVISGRALDDVVALLGLARRPEIWGSHGWERLMPDGAREPPALAPQAAQGLAEALAMAEGHGLAQRLEHKPAGLALHWRGMDTAAVQALLAWAEECWTPLARRSGLVAQIFDGGVELRAPGRDKGHAVRTVLDEVGPSAAAYLGDDLTDEDAFQAIQGRGMGALVRAQPRPTAADLWLQPPDELLAFLAHWHQVCLDV
jgi:trehalose 6-phosphate phosphatase